MTCAWNIAKLSVGRVPFPCLIDRFRDPWSWQDHYRQVWGHYLSVLVCSDSAKDPPILVRTVPAAVVASRRYNNDPSIFLETICSRRHSCRLVECLRGLKRRFSPPVVLRAPVGFASLSLSEECSPPPSATVDAAQKPSSVIDGGGHAAKSSGENRRGLRDCPPAEEATRRRLRRPPNRFTCSCRV
jgi:hypothetical protein